ncbi:MAG: adenylosuccinate synthase [Gemmatimonadetes bacterium RBG_16_66_8]|nr:MAG: adenylosuccinate synthase [Gemmatimonadetes bacterium RBG_16_66_8]
MFGPKRHCVVVVGAQWGDEGKGKIVDVLAERADVVVRYQGGANAGHTVVKGDDEFILHQIPSGILHAGTRCFIGNGVVLDPETLLAEVEELEARGVGVAGRLFVSLRAQLVLPFHKLLDQASERQQKIGTTGRGIGPAYEDKIARRGLRVGDLRHLDHACEIVTARVERANPLLEMMGAEPCSAKAHVELLERLAPRLLPMAADTGRLTYDALAKGQKVLLEGAQGALLDVDHGTYPFVTSSNTTAGGAAVGAGIGPTAIDVVLGVVKAYTTRVGNGPLPTEADSAEGGRLRELGDEYGATTGRPRRCGWFDAVVVRYAVRVNGLTDLAVTKLDVLDTMERIPVCVGYVADGAAVDDMPSDVQTLNGVKPVYEVLEGWQRPTTAARRLADLPPQARAYLDRIQDLVQVPIRYVSVGSRRDQIIC